MTSKSPVGKSRDAQRFPAMLGGLAALRCRRRLVPAGGASDKVFPATYEGGRYALEHRRVDGRDAPCVILDSVQSQANRMEGGLLELWRSEQLELPVVQVDFASAGLPEFGTVTSLDAPHRIFDAILRDSLLDGVPFPETTIGRSIERASTADATSLFGCCPTVLLLGGWNSTGKRGGLGVKFARCLVSEVVGIDAVLGVRSKSRLDPLRIAAGVEVFQSEGPVGWTSDPASAVHDKGRPRLIPARNAGDRAGRPSVLNHSSVVPSLEEGRGGVTIDHAEQTTVLSVAGLRRLGFPIQGRRSSEVDEAARSVLLLLGLISVEVLERENQQLRSRCVLVPDRPAAWEQLGASGEAPTPLSIDMRSLLEAFAQSVKAARRAGLPWNAEPVTLTPSPQLVELVQESRRRLAERGRFAIDEETA